MDQKESVTEESPTPEPRCSDPLEWPEVLPRFSIVERISHPPSAICPLAHLNTSVYPLVSGWTLDEQRALRRIIKRHVAAAAIMSFLIGLMLGFLFWGGGHGTMIIDGTPAPVAYMQTKHLESTGDDSLIVSHSISWMVEQNQKNEE